MKMKHSYQAPAIRVIALSSQPLLKAGSLDAAFMNNPGIGDDTEEDGDQ